MRQQPTRALYNALAFTAGIVGGIVELITGKRSARWRSPRKPTYALAAAASLGRHTGGFGSLRATILGYSKEELADVLGPPPAAALNSSVPASGGPSKNGFWAADTWYYPFDASKRAAVAIFFEENRVTRVEFLGGER